MNSCITLTVLRALLLGLALVASAYADRGGSGEHGWRGLGGGHWRAGPGGYGYHGWLGGYGGYYGPRYFGPMGYGNFGFFFGGPVGIPYYYPPPPMYPYYYPVPVMPMPASPSVYVERDDRPGSVPTPSNGGWRYCAASQDYYPNIQQCAAGWIEIPQVPAQMEQGYWYRCNSPAGFYPYVRNCPSGWVRTTPQPAASNRFGEEE